MIRTGRIGLSIETTLLAVLIAAPVALAQNATPTPDVPRPAECTVDPVEPAALLSSVGGADPTSPLFSTEPVDEASLPEGPAVTDEELEGITETVRQLVACANAFDPFRILALISDEYIGQLGGAALAAQQQPELAMQLMARFPVPIAAIDSAEPVQMSTIRDARLLPDGRIGAILESAVPGSDALGVFFVTFIEEEDNWLVNDVLPVASELFATPAA
ncbi:MAG TPA: hypothetical protein VGT61_15235 [Thermomicrobiales bacterium]|jgi:hypothetical protein|nr:hypothetical protein [Thermomicrobiales bacterium]